MVTNILIICGALMGSAFISAAESALLSARPSHIEHLAENGNRRAIAVMKVLEKYENFFATILLVGNAFNILVATAATTLMINSIGEGNPTALATLLALILSTTVVYTIGELIPKTLGAIAPEKWSLSVAHIILAIMVIARPIVFVFTLLPAGILRIFGVSRQSVRPGFTSGELSLIIDMSQEQGVVDETHGEMLDNLLYFGTHDLRDHRVRVHTSQIVWLSEHDTVQTFLDKYREHVDEVNTVGELHHLQPGFVVHRGNKIDTGYWYDLDQLAGIVYSDAVMRRMTEAGDQLQTPISELMTRDVLHMKDTTKLDDLFKEMIKTGHEVVVSYNQHQRINGVITRNGLLELMRGDEDIMAVEENSIEKVDDNTFILPGALSIERARDETQIEIPQNSRYETIAGFFIDKLQRMPAEKLSVGHDDMLRMTVIKMDGNRIARLEIRKLEHDESAVSATA